MIFQHFRLIIFFHIFSLDEKWLKGGYCPSSHPYAYLNGKYCCAQPNEKPNVENQGAKCDGSKLQLDSSCCSYDEYIKCPFRTCSTKKGGKIDKDKYIELHLWNENYFIIIGYR